MKAPGFRIGAASSGSAQTTADDGGVPGRVSDLTEPVTGAAAAMSAVSVAFMVSASVRVRISQNMHVKTQSKWLLLRSAAPRSRGQPAILERRFDFRRQREDHVAVDGLIAPSRLRARRRGAADFIDSRPA